MWRSQNENKHTDLTIHDIFISFFKFKLKYSENTICFSTPTIKILINNNNRNVSTPDLSYKQATTEVWTEKEKHTVNSSDLQTHSWGAEQTKATLLG